MRAAVLGLGHMGVPIAERLEQAHHELSVWNRSPIATEPFAQRDVRCLRQPADAWRHADVVITMLADDEAVKAVVLGENGLLSGDPPLSSGTLVDMSTVSAGTSAEIAAAADQQGTAYLRAPVTGNPSVVGARPHGIKV